MAEHVIWGVLSILKNARYFEDKKRIKLWEKNRKVLELHEKTVTIIGCGNVGKECAKLFKGFSCTIIGVDCKEINDDVFDKIYNVNNIEMAIKSADVVVICVPLSSETKRMFNKNMFSLMKDGSIFVNVSRGEIVEEKSLISALDDKLLGAVVDVFETEPLDTQSQLWEKENVILTPHNSFVGDGNSRRLYKVIESNLRDYKCQ
jgi:phosphoglycerate dehydrogenase-like enzyme